MQSNPQKCCQQSAIDELSETKFENLASLGKDTFSIFRYLVALFFNDF